MIPSTKGGKPLTIGSLFAGIGGFELGFLRAGFKTLWAVEKEPFCRAVLAKHFPETELFEDVRKVGKHNLRAVDVLTGGFPCQDLSVAGKRAGLAGARSGLVYEFVRIADELNPAWIVVENVPGLLSSNFGRDFACVLGELTGFFPQVPEEGWGNYGVCAGPKRGIAWRVLDSQYFGVAQRRRRLFLVANPRIESAFQVLSEPESVPGNPPSRREAGQRVAGTISARTEGGGGLGTDFDLGGAGQ